MAMGFRGLPPVFYGKTVAEVIELGKKMGVPEISWGEETGGEAYVIYHWEHGDRKIYPLLEEEHDQGTTDGDLPASERIRPADPGPAPEAGEEGALQRFLKAWRKRRG